MAKELLILVVDDDEIDQRQIKRAIKKSDLLAKITIVDNGKEALSLIKDNFYDCCIFDYLLPDLNGIDLVKKVRTNNEESAIVLVTSQTDPELSTKAINAGATNYINKSLITPEGMSVIIRNSIGLQKNKFELKHAKEEALHYADLKQSFLANMSHEIRTPMNAIIGFSKLLLDEQLKEKERKYAQTINTSAENLLAIINDILDFSKIESGKLTIEKTDFSLKNVISEVVNILGVTAKSNEIYLKYEIDSKIPDFVIGDQFRLNQILVNLISNAIKFTKVGGVDIHVSLEGKTESEFQIKIEVNDTGIGIKKENQKKIFESFSQAEGDTTRKFGGTGLGLTICTQLVELMGGQLELESKFNIGSKFYFTIPMGISKNKIQKKVEPDPENNYYDKFKDYKILLADDNEINRVLASVHFSKLGFKQVFAVNGAEALEKVLNDDFDLVFMDIQMPIMDGIEATKKILFQKQNSKVIGMSAHVLKEEIDKCLELGMVDYITKPFKPIELYKICAKYCQINTEDIIDLDNSNDKATDDDKINNGNQGIEEFDLSHLVSQFGGDKNACKTLLPSYIKNFNEYFVNMQEGIDNHDYDVLAKCNHKMIPGIIMLGLTSTAVLIKENQNYGKEKTNIDTISKNYVTIKRQLEYLLVEFEDILK